MAIYEIETDEGIFEVEVEDAKRNASDMALGAVKEASGVFPISESDPETLAGKVSNLTRKAFPTLPMFQNLSANILNPATGANVPIAGRATRFLEEKGQEVARPIEDIAGRMAERQMPMSATLLSMSAGGLTPSAMLPAIGMGGMSRIAPALGRGGVSIPLRSPTIVEQGLETTTKGLGQEGLLPSEVGQTVRQNLPVVERAPTAQEVFPPTYQKFAGTVSEKPVPMSKAGEVIKKGYESKLNKLRASESKAFKPLDENNKLKSSPAKLENSRQFIEELFKREWINETNQQGIPLDVIRKQFPNYTPPPTAENIGLMGEAQPTQTPSNLGVFSRITRMAGREDLTVNDVKQLRTDVGYEINKANGWSAPRTNEPIYRLKQIYEKLSEDYLQAADEAGLKDQVLKANKSTRDLYGYLEKPSSEMIGKSKYPSNLPRKLIDSTTPERVNELFKEHDLSPDDINVVRRGVLDEYFRKSKGDPEKFRSIWDKNTPEVKKALLGDKAKLVDALPEIQKITEKMGEDILKSDANVLNKKFSKVVDSEVVDSILKDGTPELAEKLSMNLDKNSMNVLRRGIVNKLIEGSKTEGSQKTKLNYDDINKNFSKLDDQFIVKMFGKEAKTVKAIKDASKTFTEKLDEARIGRSLPNRTGFMIQWIKGLATRYRIPANVYKMVERTQGKDIAEKIVPKRSVNIPIVSEKPMYEGSPFEINEPKVASYFGKNKMQTQIPFPIYNRRKNQ